MKTIFFICLILPLTTSVVMGLNAKKEFIPCDNGNYQDHPKSKDTLVLADSSLIIFIDGQEVSRAEYERRHINREIESVTGILDDPRLAIKYYGEKYRNGFIKFETIKK